MTAADESGPSFDDGGPRVGAPSPGRRKPAASGRRNQLGQAMGVKGAQTRRRLMDATSKLLKTTSLRDLRVAHIVREAETSQATFYVYFNDVTEAVLAVISELTQSPPNLLGMVGDRWDADSAMERAYAFVAAYVEHWEANAALFRLRNLASDEGDARFVDVRFDAVAPLIGAMADRIAEGQRAGEVPADLHPSSAAGALLAIIERISAVRLDSRDRHITRPRLVRVVALLTALLFARGPDAARRAFANGPATIDGRAETAAWISDFTPGRTRKSEPERLNLNGQEIGAKGARTRQRMLEATDELLRSKPLLEISVAEIAAAAHTSTSTFYLYFHDVQEAVLAVSAQVTQSPPDLLALVRSPWNAASRNAKSRELVERYVARWQENRALFRARNLAADEGDLRFEQVRKEATWPLLAALAERVAERQAQGDLPQDLHPPSAAAALLAMVERLAVIPNVPARREVTPNTVIEAAARYVAVLLTGADAWETGPAGG